MVCRNINLQGDPSKKCTRGSSFEEYVRHRDKEAYGGAIETTKDVKKGGTKVHTIETTYPDGSRFFTKSIFGKNGALLSDTSSSKYTINGKTYKSDTTQTFDERGMLTRTIMDSSISSGPTVHTEEKKRPDGFTPEFFKSTITNPDGSKKSTDIAYNLDGTCKINNETRKLEDCSELQKQIEAQHK